MFKFLVLLSAVACALGAAIPEGVVPVPELDGRIVGGSTTTINSYPYQISLMRSGSHSCGGSVYNNNVIVTAAHCVKNVAASALSVRAGSSYRTSGGTVIAVKNVKIHEGYNSITKNDDVALLRLSSSLSLSSTIATIAMSSTTPANGAAAVVTGWGTLTSGGSSPSQLQYVNVNIIGRSQCGNNYSYSSSQITDAMICAAAPNKDSCQGDSGGPLVSSGKQVGIVSWGSGCAEAKYPGVYTNVASVYSWINTNAKTV